MAEEGVICIEGKDKKIDSREDVVDIVKQIKDCEGLTTLQLSGNSFGVEATEAIGECLARKPRLSRALWSDMFVSRLKSEIPPALIALGKGIMEAGACLTELDFSDNAFGPTGVEPLLSLLTSPSFYSIKVLKFNNNGLGIKGGTFLAKALLQCHQEAQNAGEKFALEVFVAGRNRLENAGAKALSEVFEAVGSLVQVTMPQNGIEAEGICALAKAFSSNPNLEVINLNDNTFTEVGSKSMAEVLPNLQKLRVVNFGDCLVRPNGARAIAEAMKDSHAELEEINLNYGELDQDAGLAVAEAMANKRNLKRIDLNGNCFGETGVELVRESLEAKGHAEVLGSLSDDEGSGTDEEGSDGEEEEKKEEEEDKEVEKELNGDKTEEINASETKRVVTLESFLEDPTGENLLALGEERNQLFLDSIARNTSPNDKLSQATHVAALFVQVTKYYHSYLSGHEKIQSVIENTVDALLEPLCETSAVTNLINEILVQIGLLKSEDKKFVPVKEIEGPILALKYLVKCQYFPRISADLLIHFFTKPNPVLVPLQSKGIVYQLLQTLHTI